MYIYIYIYTVNALDLNTQHFNGRGNTLSVCLLCFLERETYQPILVVVWFS